MTANFDNAPKYWPTGNCPVPKTAHLLDCKQQLKCQSRRDQTF